MDVDHQRDVGPERLADRGHDLGVAIEALVQPTVGIGAVHRHLGLDRLEAGLLGALRPGAQRIAVLREAVPGGLQGGIGHDRLLARATEELVDRLASGLALDVPERHLDAAHRMDDGAASTVHAGPDIHAAP